jgi:menaquinone-dependent protoporphyrinogen oxidase
MSADRMLVAFSSQNGSTAGIAEIVATELRASGFTVDCLPVADVSDLEPYGAVVLGSGVFLARRGIDGGGFITRHADGLSRRPVWLFSAGPIGGPDAAPTDDPLGDEAPVVRVAHAIGARGAATFGTARLRAAVHDGGRSAEAWRDLGRVRAWAHTIAADLSRTAVLDAPPAPGPSRAAVRPERRGNPRIVVTR